MNRGAGLRIGRILGIPIYLHSTWDFIFAAITYIIASQFSKEHPLWTDTQHWTVGVLTSLLFFASFPSPSFSSETWRASSANLPRRFRNSTSRSPGRWPADCSPAGFLA